MLRESLAFSLVFDWKPNWFLSWKLFLCGESSFGLSILRGSWHRFVHLLHLIHILCFFVLEFLQGQQWWFLNLHPERSKPSVYGLDCITWYQSLNPGSSLKLYPSIRCNSIIFVFEFSGKKKWEIGFHLILVCLCVSFVLWWVSKL